ncbi:MAG: tripartite tricarboxylate transporter substrate binding protein [Alphaproteobacteria bacterium]|nr:tripartite tricarboxylate transporter substrate binding protein [Alphaproteobacteria bacterium]
MPATRLVAVHQGEETMAFARCAAAGLLAAAACLAASETVHAQAYPNRPIRMIVAFPAGGSTDIIGRIVAQNLSNRLGQQVVVDNRGGAGGTLGTDLAAKAPADGYTLTLGTTSTHAVAAGVYATLPYDPIKDFSAISLVGITPYLLVVNDKVQATSLKEFVDLVKKEPGKLNYASAGNGTATHLAMEMMADAASLKMVHVPYRGNGPAEVALLAGEVQAIFGSMPALLEQARSGKIRPLAVGTGKRSPALPNVPTVAELGYPGFEAALWLGVYAPAGTPKPVVDRLAQELRAIVPSPEFKEMLDKNGAEPLSNTPEEFQDFTRREVERYLKLVKAIGLKPQ